MASYTHSSQGTPGQSKLFLNPAALDPAGDRDNHTSFWRNPRVGNIYRNTEYITVPITQPLLTTAPIEVLDVCCGAGVVSARIQEMLKMAGQEVKGGGQIEHVRSRVEKDGWTDTTVVQADIASLPFELDSFDFIVVGMALMVVAEPYADLAELYRVLKPGGRIASSTWATEGWVYDTRDAVANLGIPGQQPVPWPQKSCHLTGLWSPGAWDDPYFAAAMYNASGLIEIKSETMPKPITFRDPEQFCTLFEALLTGTVERYWFAEQKEKLRHKLKPAIVEYLGKKYGGPFEIERWQHSSYQGIRKFSDLEVKWVLLAGHGQKQQN
ncbi:S-adenosyl-L-methionine-dependent methyltransferase [Colletotrichum phormii]|uniref:S-adenosyl-L-methionine-dependent methyltransferase n=1 Tax=Colletotrichum phormii TaxID=359342 RepID=A0AAI9ZHT1_9PEZI|nr:S-adenosyl-L-methionine-dependent methyltransferase [Colletotrichum phormii]KAK1624848.1 S-adenosyl-L-methionine-dependent methyltransferase [Colletotrichum phormii]